MNSGTTTPVIAGLAAGIVLMTLFATLGLNYAAWINANGQTPDMNNSSQGMANHLRTDTIKMGASLKAIDVNSETNMAYVPDSAYGVVFVIDGNSVPTRVLKNITTEYEPWDLAVNEATNKIYVSHNMVPLVTVIDGDTNKVNKTIPLGEEYRGRILQADIAVNSETNAIFLIDRWQDQILVIDGYQDKLVQKIPIYGPWRMAVNEKANLLYVITGGENTTLTTIDTTHVTTPVYVDVEKYKVVGVHEFEAESGEIHLRDIAVDAARNRVYLTSYHPDSRYYENQLVVIDAKTGGQTITMGSRLSAITVDPATNIIAIVNQTAMSEAEIERLQCFHITDCRPIIPTSIIFVDGIYYEVLDRFEVADGYPVSLDTGTNANMLFSSNIRPSSVSVWNTTEIGGEQWQQSLPMLEECKELGIEFSDCTEQAVLQIKSEQAKNTADAKEIGEQEADFWIKALPIQYLIGIGAAIAGFIAFLMLRKPSRMR